MPVDDNEYEIPLIMLGSDTFDKYDGISRRCYPTKVVKNPDEDNFVCPICGAVVGMKCVMRMYMPHYEIQIDCDKCCFSAIGVVYTQEKLFKIVDIENIKIERDW